MKCYRCGTEMERFFWAGLIRGVAESIHGHSCPTCGRFVDDPRGPRNG